MTEKLSKAEMLALECLLVGWYALILLLILFG